ncbi:ABC transporter permease subunit [Nannocystis sp.]|uniref:ABC transporter permease subunit n=1 Tax=Nannocystis sp. TaxID=1962667 RepID=UPI0025DEDC8C|nr:ABC transporter permease subunit [Nannocystis sp.]MBK7825565.1 ABC transporter permease subunit [Nannocystis sp.]
MAAFALASSSGRARGVAAAVGLWVLLTLGLPLVQLGQEAWSVVGPPAPPWIFVLAGLRALGLAAAVAVIAAVAAYPVARTVSARVLLVLVLVSPLARALGVLGLGMAPGVPAVLLAQSAGAIPLAALVLQLRLRGRARVWLEAAADLGAGPWRRFWEVELPLLAPALALAAGWAALWALGDVTTLELAGGGKVYTLALLLRDAVLSEANPRRAAAIVVVMLAVAVPCALAIARGLAGLAGEVSGPGPRAGSGLRALGWLGVGLSALPLAGLIGQLSLRTDGSGGLLLRGLLARSLALTLGCGLLAAALGFTLALLRRRSAGRDAVAALVLLPLAVPPVVYGALMLPAGRLLGLMPGPGLTLLGLLPMRVALAYAGAVLAVAAVQPEVIDGARDLGAGAGARLLRVWWPLLAPAGLALALVGFAHALADSSVPAFTAGPGGSTLAVGMTIVARGGEVDVVPRWALGLSLAPVAVVMISAWAWRPFAASRRRAQG